MRISSVLALLATLATTVTSLGINCRGSGLCPLATWDNKSPLPVMQVIRDALYESKAPASTTYNSGDHVICVSNTLSINISLPIIDPTGLSPTGSFGSWQLAGNLKDGGICLFPQYLTGGPTTLGMVRKLADKLLEHGCGTCGSVPIHFVDQGSNDPGAGILTFNYVRHPYCTENCLTDGLPPAAQNATVRRSTLRQKRRIPSAIEESSAENRTEKERSAPAAAAAAAATMPSGAVDLTNVVTHPDESHAWNKTEEKRSVAGAVDAAAPSGAVDLTNVMTHPDEGRWNGTAAATAEEKRGIPSTAAAAAAAASADAATPDGSFDKRDVPSHGVDLTNVVTHPDESREWNRTAITTATITAEETETALRRRHVEEERQRGSAVLLSPFAGRRQRGGGMQSKRATKRAAENRRRTFSTVEVEAAAEAAARKREVGVRSAKFRDEDVGARVVAPRVNSGGKGYKGWIGWLRR